MKRMIQSLFFGSAVAGLLVSGCTSPTASDAPEEPDTEGSEQVVEPREATGNKCWMFEGLDGGNNKAQIMACGQTGAWGPQSLYWPPYQNQPFVDGKVIWSGWGSTVQAIRSVTTVAERNAVMAARGANWRGNCDACLSPCPDEESPYYWPSNGRCYPCPEGQIKQPDGNGDETCQPRCAGLTGAALTACEDCSVDGGVACRCNQFPPASQDLCFCLAFAGAEECYPPPPSCDDDLQNQGEQGLDCGGPCETPCDPPTCSDNIQNQNEEGVDCGGPCETACPLSTCSDSVRNQNEEGFDCGGPCPTPCFAATCNDGVQNQDETGIDCGGSCTACPTCSDGKSNQNEQDIDCGGPCATACPSPTCTDGKRNQGEEGLDCGGPCPTACDAPTCTDGKLNQGEQEVDCGGPCLNLCPAYTVQVRRLFMPPLGYHEDVCVDNTCYTSGPLEGNYRRDPDGSDWVLTDAGEWSTTPGFEFKVTKPVRDMLVNYMEGEVVGTVSKTNFLANILQYFRDGFCKTFSRTHFNYLKYLAQMIDVPGTCFCTATCQACVNEGDEDQGVSLDWPVDRESMCRPEVAQSDLEFECKDKGCGYATGTTCLFLGGF